VALAVTLTIGLSPAVSAAERPISEGMQVGQSTTTVNRDGSITTSYAVSSSCTQSYTAYVPFRGSDMKVTAKTYVSNGPGCPTVYPYSALRRAGCCGGYSVLHDSVTTLGPNQGWTVVHVYYCKGPTQKAYKSYVQIGVGAGAESRWAYLQCG
jgi:hypothetical protein